MAPEAEKCCVTKNCIRECDQTISMIKSVTIYKVTLKDISEAFQMKPETTLEDVRKKLNPKVKELAHLFPVERGVDKLPSLRGLLDHAINLRKDDGKLLTPQ